MDGARRRQLLFAAGALAAAPLHGLGQTTAPKVARIGFLGASDAGRWKTRVDAFRAGLLDLGYVEGRNVVIEYRYAEGRYERLPELAAELVGLKVDVIVTHAVPGALAAKNATPANGIPVVMTNVGDAVAAGLVASLARPGGNVTGDTFYVTELVAKRLEVLKSAIPGLRRVAAFVNPDNVLVPLYQRAMDVAARELGLALLTFPVRGPADLDAAFAAIAKESVDALTVVEDVVLISLFRRIADLSARQRLPSISFVDFPDAGGLFGYGVDILALYRRAAFFVDRILKGTKPADIPVERPTNFQFVINMKTARAIGFAISPAIRMRADREIE